MTMTRDTERPDPRYPSDIDEQLTEWRIGGAL